MYVCTYGFFITNHFLEFYHEIISIASIFQNFLHWYNHNKVNVLNTTYYAIIFFYFSLPFYTFCASSYPVISWILVIKVVIGYQQRIHVYHKMHLPGFVRQEPSPENSGKRLQSSKSLYFGRSLLPHPAIKSLQKLLHGKTITSSPSPFLHEGWRISHTNS